MRRLSLLPSGPHYPTASELRIASECVSPWALGLPEVSETNEWAEKGRRLHAAVEAIAKAPDCDLGPIDALPDSMFVEVNSLLIRDKVLAKPGTWRVEQGIKWRPGVLEDEAEFCERRPGERALGWFAGTADLAYVRVDGLLVVADWKFGPREHVTGEPANESCQGFFLALAFATKLSIRGSGPGVVVARFERRVVSESGIEVDAVDITQGELDAFAEQLRGLAKRIETAEGAVPRISAACGKCKARAACPGWDQFTGLVVDDIVSQTGERASRALFRAPESPEDVRTLHYAIGAAESYSAEWKRLRDAYVLTHPEGVGIGLGLKLKAIPSKDREALDTPEALDVIERIAGPKAIEVQRKSGIGRIKAALRDGAGEGISSKSDRDKTKKAAEENGFAELTRMGAVIDKGKKLAVRVVRSDEEERSGHD
jgi:hypothetical protein